MAREYVRCATCGKLQSEDSHRKRFGCTCGSKTIRRYFSSLRWWERIYVIVDQAIYDLKARLRTK